MLNSAAAAGLGHVTQHCMARKIASLKLKTTTAWMMTDDDIYRMLECHWWHDNKKVLLQPSVNHHHYHLHHHHHVACPVDNAVLTSTDHACWFCAQSVNTRP